MGQVLQRGLRPKEQRREVVADYPRLEPLDSAQPPASLLEAAVALTIKEFNGALIENYDDTQ